VTVDIHSTV